MSVTFGVFYIVAVVICIIPIGIIKTIEYCTKTNIGTDPNYHNYGKGLP